MSLILHLQAHKIQQYTVGNTSSCASDKHDSHAIMKFSSPSKKKKSMQFVHLHAREETVIFACHALQLPICEEPCTKRIQATHSPHHQSVQFFLCQCLVITIQTTALYYLYYSIVSGEKGKQAFRSSHHDTSLKLQYIPPVRLEKPTSSPKKPESCTLL